VSRGNGLLYGGTYSKGNYAPSDVEAQAANYAWRLVKDGPNRPTDVRFTPKSGHRNAVVECPLCANTGREQVQQ
jgi:hypothetical protein